MRDDKYTKRARDSKPTATILKFPPRHRDAIMIRDWPDGGWLVLAPRGHGWVHGNRDDARRDASWLAANWRLPIRELAA
jgi:hypothetical protein